MTVLLCLACQVACGFEVRDDVPGLGGTGGIDPVEDTSTGDEAIEDVAIDGLDLAGNPDGGAFPCNGVDILFVVDGSTSMSDNQEALVASVPAFVADIEREVDLPQGYHVGVITTEQYAWNGTGCTGIGSLITRTGGAESSAAACGPYAEGNYMTDADDLPATFGCAALVGIDGLPGEKPLDAARLALTPELGAAGACNEGFLREESLLILVFITDEEDDTILTPPTPFMDPEIGSDGDPVDWFTDLVDLKNGPETNIVVLSLVGTAPDVCGAQHAPRLIEFTEMFTYGFVGDVCAPSFGGFFADAVSTVNDACLTFTPEG